METFIHWVSNIYLFQNYLYKYLYADIKEIQMNENVAILSGHIVSEGFQ